MNFDTHRDVLSMTPQSLNQDVGQDIDAKIKTLLEGMRAKVLKIRAVVKEREYIRSADVVAATGLSAAAASALLKRMLDQGLIHPIAHHGKGAYRM